METSKTVITPIIENPEAWLEQRRKGLGGSDIAAICGLSPFAGAIDIWLQKMGMAPPKPETAAMHWGHNLEDVIAQEYARATGNEVLPGVHLQNGCRVGNTDRMVPGAKRILEVKTASPYMAGEWGEPWTDEIPEHYLTQVQWYLGMLDPAEYEGADVPVLIGGNDFRIYRVDRDDDLIAQLIDIGESWWREFIEGNKAPEPDGSMDDMRSRLTLHPKDNGQMLEATPEMDDLARQLDEAKAALTSAEGIVEDLELQMKTIIGDASGVTGTDWSCTWKAPKASKTTDWKAVCAKAGVAQAIIDEFTTSKNASRRFLFKPKFSKVS